jgi:hypothetical protein
VLAVGDGDDLTVASTGDTASALAAEVVDRLDAHPQAGEAGSALSAERVGVAIRCSSRRIPGTILDLVLGWS